MITSNPPFFVIAWMLLLVGCGPVKVLPDMTPTPTPGPSSSWGPISIVGQAEQSHAPALWVNDKKAALAWVGAESSGVHQYMRGIDENGLSEIVDLPVPSPRAMMQQLYPAADGYHLLWLDRYEFNDTRLFNIYLNSGFTVQPSPEVLSDTYAMRFDALPVGDGALQVAWVGNIPAEPSLFFTLIDGVGRPLTHFKLVDDADYPALLKDAGSLRVYWIGAGGSHVFSGLLVSSAMQDTTRLVESVRLEAGDRLQGFHAALDATHAYLFWNITRVDGTHETWWAMSPRNSLNWSRPEPLRVDVDPSGQPIDTPYSAVQFMAASAGTGTVSWAVPLNQGVDGLPVVLQLGDTLGLLYLRGGAITGFSAVASPVQLIGEPAAAVDSTNRFYVTWSNLTPHGYSDLDFISSNP